VEPLCDVDEIALLQQRLAGWRLAGLCANRDFIEAFADRAPRREAIPPELAAPGCPAPYGSKPISDGSSRMKT